MAATSTAEDAGCEPSCPSGSSSDDSPPGGVIYTGPDEPNLRVVDVLATQDEDRNGSRCSSSKR
jgi:hypothetical protein